MPAAPVCGSGDPPECITPSRSAGNRNGFIRISICGRKFGFAFPVMVLFSSWHWMLIFNVNPHGLLDLHACVVGESGCRLQKARLHLKFSWVWRLEENAHFPQDFLKPQFSRWRWNKQTLDWDVCITHILVCSEWCWWSGPFLFTSLIMLHLQIYLKVPKTNDYTLHTSLSGF